MLSSTPCSNGARLVQPSPAAGTDRQHAIGGKRTGVLLSTGRVSHGGLTQITDLQNSRGCYMEILRIVVLPILLVSHCSVWAGINKGTTTANQGNYAVVSEQGPLQSEQMDDNAQFNLAQTGNGIEADEMFWKYKGKQILLLGGMAYGEPHLIPRAELIRELDKLKESGGNYMRMTMVSVFDKTRVQGMYPFTKRSDGKFDLDQFNPAFWDYVRVLFEETQKREMVVQVELWDQWEFYRGNYDETYWNPKNNINYDSSATGLDLSLIHISEPTRRTIPSRMPSSA